MIKPGLFLIVLFNQISLQRFLMPVKVYLLRISRKPLTRLLCVLRLVTGMFHRNAICYDVVGCMNILRNVLLEMF
jgi:hypothetical protein